MSAVWPTTLPADVLRAGYGEQPLMRKRSFQSDTGPAIEAPKGTVRMSILSVSMFMTSDQVKIFEDFVFYDLGQATQPFYVYHPRTGVQVKVKIEGEEPYQIAELTPDKWKIVFSILVIG